MTREEPVRVISCHAEGEVGDVVVEGVEPPPGETLWEQARYLDRDGELRDYLLNEPRGGVFRHVNLLVPARHPDAQMGFLIMEPEHTPPMSGSNSMCVATVLLETGILPMTEPVTRLVLEAPGGLVRVEAQCAGGRVEHVTIENVPSFACELDATLEVEGVGTLEVDTAYGGDSFVMVDAERLGFSLDVSEARELAEMGVRITAAATEQLGFVHPARPDWSHISFCQIAGPRERRADGALSMRNAVAIEPGKVDRSPTGTGVSARMAVLHARREMDTGESLFVQSLVDSEFRGQIRSVTSVAGREAVVPSIRGRAWVTGEHFLRLDPTDPWPRGYRLSDTWPGAGRID